MHKQGLDCESKHVLPSFSCTLPHLSTPHRLVGGILNVIKTDKLETSTDFGCSTGYQAQQGPAADGL